MEFQTFAIGIIFLIIFCIIKRPRVGANEPPLVPFTIPILGHTYDYLFNPKNFVKKCKGKYGECFSVYVFGSMMTIVSGKFVNEVFSSHEDFDLTSASNEIIPFQQFLIYNGGVSRKTIPFFAKTTRDQISGNLEFNIRITQKHLSKGIDKWIGDCNDPKILYNAWHTINDITALPVANILVGEEAASHDDLVKSIGDVSFDMGPLLFIPPVFSFIHKKLHEFMVTLPMRFGWNPVSYHRKIIMNRLKPVIEKRLKEKAELGDNYKPHGDLLDYYMNLPNFDYTDPNNLPYHIDNIFILVFAAAATTSKAATNALYDLAGRPECLNELYEEALLFDKECNGSLTATDIRNMKKLDSFVKESFRHSEDIINFPHYMISKSYTFSNGATIPKGRMTMMCVDDSLKSKENFGGDAEEFKPFRFVNENSPATKVDRSFIFFGGGKHACPGRFFAVNEIKLLLHQLILKYHITTKSGKIENKIPIGPVNLPSRSGLVFVNRK